MANEQDAQAPPVADEAEANQSAAADSRQSIDPEYASRLKREAHENRRRAKAAEEALAAREREEAQRKGDYEKLAKSATDEARKAREEAAQHKKRYIDAQRTRAASDALLSAGITDPDVVKALTSHVQQHVEVDEDTFEVGGKFAAEAKKLAAKWGKAQDSQPKRVIPGIPGGQTSGNGRPKTPKEALAADIYAKFGRG
jgi:hypothetical protein